MSLPGSEDESAGVSVKPRADVYTVFLIVAFLALAIGTLLLYFEAADYGPTPAGEPTVQTSFYQPSPIAPMRDGLFVALHTGELSPG